MAPVDRYPNFARIFSEAMRQTIIDAYPRERIVPGYYLIMAHGKPPPGKMFPLMPARIWWRDHEPGDVCNKLDRWPLPVLAGEVAGDYCDPVLVWTGKNRQPLVPDPGFTLDGWYRYQVALARWRIDNAPEEPGARPHDPVDLTSLPPTPPPPKGTTP